MPDFTATARGETLDIRGAMSADDARRMVHEETGAAPWTITVTPAEQARIKRLADDDWNALASEPCARLHAKQRLAEMTPARRAELERLFA